MALELSMTISVTFPSVSAQQALLTQQALLAH
jgi:hypothetical protein